MENKTRKVQNRFGSLTKRFGQGSKLERELKGKFIIGFFFNIYNQNYIYL